MAVLRRVLVVMIWVPIQIILSLIFATGGLFLVIPIAILLSPVVGLYFLVRHLRRPVGLDEPAGPDG